MKKNYENMTAQELKDLAKEKKVKNWWNLKKAELVEALSTVDKVEEVAEEVKDFIEEKKPTEKKAPTSKKKAEKVEKNEDNIVTLKELASDYNIKGSKARRLLREAGIERPFKRWEWDQEEHHDILTEVKVLLGGGQEE